MSCVHFKFKSSLDYEKITFEGLHIALAELREAIMKQKKIGLSNEFKLEVVDAQSKKVYDKDSEMIPRNSSVIVRRIPIPNAPKLPKTQHKDPSLIPQATSSDTQGKLSADELRKVADLSAADASEEDKLMAMMSQSGVGFDPSQYAKAQRYTGAGGGGGAHPGLRNPPPPNYVCYRCGQKGHWIKFCPTNGNPSFDRLPYKRSIGIPSTHVSLANPGMPGAMMNRFGEFVVRTVDFNAVKTGKVKGKGEALEAPEEVEVPPELTCSLCKELMKDAVTIPCCGASFCDDCIRDHLLDNEFTCPACKEEDVSPDTLAPNKDLRTAAKDFRSKVAERKSVAMARGFVATVTPNQALVGSRGFTRSSLPGPAPTQTSVSTSLAVTTAAPLRSSRVSIVRSTPLTYSASTPPRLTTATSALPTSTTVPPTSTTAPPTSTTVVTTSSSRDSTPVTSASQEPDNEAKSGSVSLVNGVVASTSKLDSTPPADSSSAPPTTEPLPEPAGSSLTVPGQASASSRAPRSRSPSPARSASPRPAPAIATDKKEADTSAVLPGPALVTPAVLPPPIPPALLGTVLPSPALLVKQLAAVGSAPLPGLVSVLPAPPVGVMPGLSLPGVLAPPVSSSSSSKLDRIAADLLLSSASVKPSRSASPPLTAEEFYRQQKMLKHLVLKSKKRTSVSPESSYSSSSQSRSSTSSSSFSRSGSYSGSSHSRSYTRSRSRSPVRSKHRSSKKLKRDRKEHYEREHEKPRHLKRKRKRHDSVEAVEHHSRKTKRHRSKSPIAKRKKVPPEPLLSPGISTSTGTSENEHKSHRHRHKKRRKRHHEDLEEVAVTITPAEEATSPATTDNQAVSSEPELGSGKALGVPLVPYQDSSATDVDRREDSELNSEGDGGGAVAMEEEEEQQQEVEEGQLPPQPPAVQEEEEDAQLLAELEDAITLHVDESFDAVGAELGLIQETATPTPTPSVNSTQTKEEGEISDSEDDDTPTDQPGKPVIPAPETERQVELTTELGKEDESELEKDETELKKDEAEFEMEEEEEEEEAEVHRVVSMSKGHSVASAVLLLPPVKSDRSSAYTEESDNVNSRHREKRKHKHKSKEKHDPKKHDPRKKKKKSRKHEVELAPAHKPSRKHEAKSRKHKKSSHSDRHRH